MNGVTVPIYVAVIAAISALGVGIANAWAMRRKASADAATLLTGAALEMYDKVSTRCDQLEFQVKEMRVENKQLQGTLDRLESSNDMLQLKNDYLWAGVLKLTEQLRRLDIEPEWTPDEKQWRDAPKDDE